MTGSAAASARCSKPSGWHSGSGSAFASIGIRSAPRPRIVPFHRRRPFLTPTFSAPATDRWSSSPRPGGMTIRTSFVPSSWQRFRIRPVEGSSLIASPPACGSTECPPRRPNFATRGNASAGTAGFASSSRGHARRCPSAASPCTCAAATSSTGSRGGGTGQANSVPLHGCAGPPRISATAERRSWCSETHRRPSTNSVPGCRYCGRTGCGPRRSWGSRRRSSSSVHSRRPSGSSDRGATTAASPA